MLQEAEHEVLDEEEIEQEMRQPSREWGDTIEDGSLPPLDTRANTNDMGWGPSASMTIDA
jgi:hypothetical protein